MGEFRMPSLGADMDKGTVLEWLVAPGDEVHRGDTIVVIDTDKSDIEAETFESGVIGEILVDVGTEVPVGTPLATIVGADAGVESTPAPPPEVVPRVAATRAPEVAPRPVGAVPTTAHDAGVVLSPLVRHLAETHDLDPAALHGSGPGGRVTRHDVEEVLQRSAGPDRGFVRASPRARRLASEAGIDLAHIPGTGPGGAVVSSDVAGASATPARRSSTGPVDRSERIRGAIAAAMARSKREIPHYYLQTTIDLAEPLDWLRARNEELTVQQRILPAALLLAATARVAARHPELNGSWEGGHRPAAHVHMGVAVSLRGGGLVAPGIEGADGMTLPEVMAALRDLVKRARGGRLRRSEQTGQTITVTNLGDLGVETVLGVINPPQLAMVGFGSVHDAAVAVDGEVRVHPVVVASLAADHRASDGMAGAAFLTELDATLHDPDQLMEVGR